MRRFKVFLLSLTLISFGLPSTSKEIELRIIIGPNTNSKLSHYDKVASRMNDLLSSAASTACSNASIKLATVRKFSDTAYNGDPINSENTRLDLIQKLLSYDGNVLGVRALNACGSKTGSTIAGCAGIDTPISVEFTQDVRRDAVKLLHEIGHSLGMAWHTAAASEVYSDDKAHVTDAKRLMHKYVSVDGKIDKSECTRFTEASDLFKTLPGYAAASELSPLNAASGVNDDQILEVETDLEAVLSRVWAESIPFEELDELSRSNNFLNELRGLIFREDKMKLWINALDTFGYYGEESDISFLKSFLDRVVLVENTRAQLLADSKIQAAISFGRLAARFRSSQGQTVVGAILAETAAAVAQTGSQNVPSVNLDGLPDTERRFVNRSLLYGAYESTALIRASQGLDTTAAVMDEQIDDLLDKALGAVSQPGDISRFTLDIDENFLNELPDVYSGVQASGIDSYLRSKNR